MSRKLEQRRKMVGLTQSDVAKLSGVLYSRVVFAESGRRRLTKDEMGRIERVLEKRVEKIRQVA